jgi:sirohydrochlorin cobaltochelatase
VSRDVTQGLAAWLAAGYEQIGEIVIRSSEFGGFDLRHHADSGRDDLELHSTPDAARHLANVDAAGEFRPLKTAPNLRRGWRMHLPDLSALRRALDYFYPAMLGALASDEHRMLPVVHLRETLGRQSGMYAVTKKITDRQAQAMIGEVCPSAGGCLKTILWRIAPELAVESLPPEKFEREVNQLGGPGRALPMLCHEVCNLLVAKAREVVKSEGKAPT